jgi:hypothetical protein
MGLFTLYLDKSNANAELAPLRSSAITDTLEVVDITNFLQLSPCKDCVKISGVGLDSDNNLVVTIGIKHPFDAGDSSEPITGKNRGDLHVFNVEGIVASQDDSSTGFSELGMSIASAKLLNASGYTGYLDAALDEDILQTNANLHPYILHFAYYSAGNFDASNPMGFASVTDPPPSGNLVMAMGCDYSYRDYVFYLPDNEMTFTFAVGCSYGVSAANYLDRFAPEYRIPQHLKKAASEIIVLPPVETLKELNPTQEITLQIEVVDPSHGVTVGPSLDMMLYDSSVETIEIEIPGILSGTMSQSGGSAVSGSGHSADDPLLYEFTFANDLSAEVGIYPGLVKVTDTYPTGSNLSYFVLGKDGIKRVPPGIPQTDGAFEMDEFATYGYFEIEVELGQANDPTIYDVGPGYPYLDPSEVPWESLESNSLVRIHWRDEPYADKWVIARAGTLGEPIIVRGILDAGRRPIITGENAKTRQELNYWNEKRSVIKVGGSSYPSDFPTYITIENLDIRSGHPNYSFTDDQGNTDTYADNAASVHIEMGDHITLRNCILHDSGNGLFVGNQSSDVLIDGNYIHDNGCTGSMYEHNSYTEALSITFQFNHYGPLKPGSEGNNLKDRSAGTVIRYNWIETGSRMCDLVDSHNSLLIDDPRYRETFVYGNVLIKTDLHGNSGVIHYGGDSGTTSDYRKGTLWCFNNTVVSYRTTRTMLFQLSTNDENVECFNNLFYDTAGGDHFYIMGNYGIVDLYNNWLQTGWHEVNGTLQGTINVWDNIEGTNPLFVDFVSEDFHIESGSACRNAAIDLPGSILPDHDLLYQYIKHQGHELRPYDVHLDIGAFEN